MEGVVLLMPQLFECDNISTNTPNFMRIDVVKCAWTRVVVLARMGDPSGSHPPFFPSKSQIRNLSGVMNSFGVNSCIVLIRL